MNASTSHTMYLDVQINKGTKFTGNVSANNKTSGRNCDSTLSEGTAADHNNHASHADPALAVMYTPRVHPMRIRNRPSRLQSKRGTNTNHCQYPIAVNEIHSTNK